MQRLWEWSRRVCRRLVNVVKRWWSNKPANNVEKIVFGALNQINGELKKGMA